MAVKAVDETVDVDINDNRVVIVGVDTVDDL